MPRLRRVLLASLAVAAGPGALVACGGEDAGRPAGSATTTTTAASVEFPRADRTLRALREGVSEGPVLAPAVSQFHRGENRFSFALFDRAQEPVEADAVAVYTADRDGSDLRGPFLAREESLAVSKPYRSRQTAADADEVKGFWVAEVPFRRHGSRVVTALVQRDGELAAASQIQVSVGQENGPPRVGEKAPRIHTPTVDDVEDLASIDTRQPPLPSLHDADFADVLGRKPVVLIFATPQLCQTRVCGPVVDIAAEVDARTDGVEFIHQEIYRQNRLDKGFRPQVGRYRLPTEPWTFVVDRQGRVVERFEGAISVDELERAVRKVS